MFPVVSNHFWINRVGKMGRDQQLRIDAEPAFRFYKAAYQYSIYLMHSWHHAFSAAHSEQDIDAALDGIEASICEAMKG